MQVTAKAMPEKKGFVPEVITKESMELTFRASDAHDLWSLARLFRWVMQIQEEKGSVGQRIDSLLDAAMFENKYRKFWSEECQAVYSVLKDAYPDIPQEKKETVYLVNKSYIRVCVVSEAFRGVEGRAQLIMGHLKKLPTETRDKIIFWFGLTPEEVNPGPDSPPSAIWRAFRDNTSW